MIKNPSDTNKTVENTNIVLRIGNKIPFSGIICALLAGISFTAGKLLIKKTRSIHPTVVVSFRGFVTLIFYGLIVFHKKLSIFGRNKSDFYCLLGRGFFGFLVSVTSYTALWLIPLGDAITIILSSTVITSVFAKIFLKEDFTLINYFYVFLTMVGVVLIAEPPFLFDQSNESLDTNRLIGISLTLIAAMSFACSYILLRNLKGVHVDLIISYFGFFTFAGTLSIMPIMKNYIDDPSTLRLPNNLYDWYYLITIVICGMLGEFFLTSAFQLEKAYVVAIARGSDIVIAFLAELIFLPNEIIKLTSILGSVIILISIILTALTKLYNEKKNKELEITKSTYEKTIKF